MSLLFWLACSPGGYGGGHYAPGDSAWLLLQTGVDPVNDDLWVLDLGVEESQDSGLVDSGPTPFFPALFRVHGESHSSRRVLDLDPDGYGWLTASVDFIQGGVVVSDYNWEPADSGGELPTLHGLIPRNARGVTATLEGGRLVSSPTGEFLLHFLEDDAGVVLVSDDFSRLQPLSLDNPTWTPDGLLRTLDASTGTLQLWDPASLSLVRELRLPPFMGEAASWRLRPDMQQALAIPKADGPGKQQVFYAVDLVDGDIRTVRGLPRSGRYNDDGSAFYGVSGDSVIVADTETWEPRVVPHSETAGAWVTPGGRFLVMEDTSHVEVVDLEGEGLASKIHDGNISWLPVLVHESLWWPAGEGNIGTLDFQTGQLSTFRAPCSLNGSIAWQPNADRVALRCEEGLAFYEREGMVWVETVGVR